jgi:hypothetical protein
MTSKTVPTPLMTPLRVVAVRGQVRGQCAGVHRGADAHGINRGDDDVEQEERAREIESAGFADAVRQRKAKVLADPTEPAQREGVEQQGEK